MERSSRRIDAVDAARGLAILGMFGAHLGPSWVDPTAPRAWEVMEGPPSLLFVVLAGVSLTLTTRPTRPLVVRAALVFVLGVALASLNSPIWVILPTTGALLAAGVALRRLSTAALGGVAVAGLLAGPAIVAAAREWTPEPPGHVRFADLADPAGAAWQLLVTGPFPAVVWIVPFLFGIALGRLDLRDRRTIRGLAIAAAAALLLIRAAVAIAAPAAADRATAAATLSPVGGGVPHPTAEWLLGAWPHAGTTFELATGVAAATLVLALLALAAGTAPVRGLATLGRVALTLYVVQVLLLTAIPDLAGRPAGEALVLLVPAGAASWALAAWLLSRWSGGPAERLLARIGDRG